MSALLATAQPQAAPMQQRAKCRLCYETYNDEFELGEDGSLAAAAIDEEYCLSDIIPGCQIYLSKHSPAEYTRLAQADPSLTAQSLYVERWPVLIDNEAGPGIIPESSSGCSNGGGSRKGSEYIFPRLEPGATYYVWVESGDEHDNQQDSAAARAAQCAKLEDRVKPHHIGGGHSRTTDGADEAAVFDEPYAEYTAGPGLPGVWGGNSEEPPNDDAQAHALATGRSGDSGDDEAPPPLHGASSGLKTWA